MRMMVPTPARRAAADEPPAVRVTGIILIIARVNLESERPVSAGTGHNAPPVNSRTLTRTLQHSAPLSLIDLMTQVLILANVTIIANPPPLTFHSPSTAPSLYSSTPLLLHPFTPRPAIAPPPPRDRDWPPPSLLSPWPARSLAGLTLEPAYRAFACLT
jgi:hypothetical protein